jgi:uncharacterized membrane protein YhhN
MTEIAARPARLSPLLVASLAAGLAYPLFWNIGLADSAEIALKGAGVGLLALLAAMQARSANGWLLAAVMAFGALGDVLLEISFEAGAAAFAVGHLVAITLYLRNRRAARTASQWAFAAALPLFGIVMPLLLLGSDGAQVAGFTVYSLLLTLMAATAWVSRFPRYRTGFGAVLFVVSDTLIAARMGPLAGAEWVSYAIWLLYYVGQLLIFLGVSATLRGDRR